MREVKMKPVDEDLKKNRPCAAKYAQIYGQWNLIPEPWNDVKLGRFKNTEEVYKECVRRGVTWQELLDYKPDPDIIL